MKQEQAMDREAIREMRKDKQKEFVSKKSL